MKPLEIILGIVMILVSVVIIALIIFQQSHRRGINGAISGAADTFIAKNKTATAEAKLAKWTTILLIAFFALAILGNVFALIW